jgi:hypothetical protein
MSVEPREIGEAARSCLFPPNCAKFIFEQGQPKTRTYRALTDARDWRFGFISRADVADFLVKQIDDNSFLGTTPVLSD